ncbi:nuclear GTPase SLIP-GC [Fundulus heteroclitus]|uniref:nuclear GTPase SLIP-GC n=1 Tax=Fundulus heteroclitus TaxID=8078 RepID=UPI00165B7A66|nr:nuclear GTPase SLIP-GC [Fundulus heteroclitus]
MDDFVCGILNEWHLSELIDTFRDEGIDSESLFELKDEHIDKLIPKMGPNLKFKRRLNLLKMEQNTNQRIHHVPPQGQQEGEEATGMTEVLPSTSNTGKRNLDPLCESSKGQPAVKRKRETNSVTETRILNSVKNTMGYVLAKLNNQDDTNLKSFLKTKIKNLETGKKELVCVFGKTGAGKTSLINAVLGEKMLLPSGSIEACTSVMLKVEANKCNERYEAEIEFISPEEWEDELGSLCRTVEKGASESHDKNDDDDDEDDDDYHEAVDKLTALYGEEWREKSCEQLMEPKYFKGIYEFLHSEQKTLAFESAKELSRHIVKYTRNGTNETNTEINRWFWPIVKSVTVRVPKNNFLQHVTLVDLPGNGDRNKSRDSMWKMIVGNCSTAWVVAEINRAAADKESWDILKEISSQLGNGGECRHIHFICTKSDLVNGLHEYNKEDAQALILKRNMETKKSVNKELNKLTKLKKHFSDECFQVFTVSSEEFFRGKYLSPENTEIPRLQEFVQNLNDSHSETLNYVSGAHGILSLIHGADSRKEDSRNKEVYEALGKNVILQTELIKKEMTKIQTTFEDCLREGVVRSITSCDKILSSFLYPRKSGRGFHKQLKKAVENGGIYKPNGRGKEMNLNMKLTSSLTDSIDDEFRNTFPNEGQSGPFKGVINKFTLDTEGLKQKYKEFELQLVFLKSEEDRLKTDLEKSIRKQKKTVYRSLTKTIGEAMQVCYKKAAAFEGTGILQNMRETIEKHVYASKNFMFEDAKNVMMTQLNDLMVEVLETLQNTMKEYIEVSLRTDEHSVPDVSAELEMVQKLYEELLQSS